MPFPDMQGREEQQWRTAEGKLGLDIGDRKNGAGCTWYDRKSIIKNFITVEMNNYYK